MPNIGSTTIKCSTSRADLQGIQQRAKRYTFHLRLECLDVMRRALTHEAEAYSMEADAVSWQIRIARSRFARIPTSRSD